MCKANEKLKIKRKRQDLAKNKENEKTLACTGLTHKGALNS